MVEVKLYKTTWKALKVLALAVPFVALGIWMISDADIDSTQRVFAWLATLFFSMGILVGLFHLFDRRPQIIITETGIWDRTTNQPELRWEQLQGAYLVSIYGEKFISLVVDSSVVFVKKQRRWAAKVSESVGAQRLNLSIGQVGVSHKKMVSFINEMMQAQRQDRAAVIKSYFEK